MIGKMPANGSVKPVSLNTQFLSRGSALRRFLAREARVCLKNLSHKSTSHFLLPS